MAGSDTEACARYFRSQKVYDRFFRMMRKKWESYGRTAGFISLREFSQEERVALERFLGRSLLKGGTRESARVSLKEFEAALGETRFGAIPLEQLLEAYYGEKIRTNKVIVEQERQEREDFLGQARQEFEDSGTGAAVSWIGRMQSEKNYGYQALMAEYSRGREGAAAVLRQAGNCLRILEEREDAGEMPIRLALLAAQTNGNPHSLDRGRTAGLLLTHALCSWKNQAYPHSAQEQAELYFSCGIQVDEISSTVAAFGIHLETDAGRHPAYEGFIALKEPCLITLSNLNKVRRAYGMWGGEYGSDGAYGGREEDGNGAVSTNAAKPRGKAVYIVENEMVFSHLLDLVKSPATLLCTSGQLRTAAFILLDLLAAEGAEFYYAGDLDPEGMLIADRLWRRYPGQMHIWHMDEEDYLCSISEEPVDGRRLMMLAKLEHPGLRRTAEALRGKKLAGYQEKLVEGLLRDIETVPPVLREGTT